MKSFNKYFFLLGLSLFALTSCEDDDDNDNAATPKTASLSLDLNGLEDLGDAYAYEGWIMVDGTPQTTGVFTVNADGTQSKQTACDDALSERSACFYPKRALIFSSQARNRRGAARTGECEKSSIETRDCGRLAEGSDHHLWASARPEKGSNSSASS